MAPIGKHRPDRRIDRQPAHALGVSSGDGSGLTAPPIPPALTPPSAPTLATALTYSAVTPGARIDASWSSGLESYDGESYSVQISTDATFVLDTTTYTTAPNQQNVSIDGLRVNTLYYVRVRTIVGATGSDWGASASITTPIDTTPPAAVTSQAAAFINTGDLIVTWTNPTSLNYKDTEVKIYASNGGALLATLYDAVSPLIWTAAQNLAATSQVGDPTLYIELRAHSWGNVFSSSVNVSATKAAPAAPTISVDFTGADCVYTITPPADAAGISFIANLGVVARRIGVVGRYVYPFDQNRLDNGVADPTLAYSFTCVDGLNQVGPTTSGTATNAAPSAPTITLVGAFNMLVCRVTSAEAADFWHWEYNWKRDGTLSDTQTTAAAQRTRETTNPGDDGVHSWTVEVRQQDVFNQFSGYTVSSAVLIDTMTMSYLRSGAFYSDDVGNTFTPPASGTLALLKDDDKITTGVTYSA